MKAQSPPGEIAGPRLSTRLAARVLRLSRPVVGSVVCAVILANTGYLGVPLVGALLGHDDIPDAVAWDALVSNTMLYLPGFAVGAAFGTQAGEGARERTAAFLTRNPVLYALVAGLLMPASWSPDVLFDAAKFIAGYGVLPLGFFLLGVNHLLSAMEAYVSAHLWDFPGDLNIQAAPGGGVAGGVSIPVRVR